FSFMRDGPLDMRLDPTSGRSAAALIAALPEEELASIIRRYGEEPRARAIARKLVAERDSGPIDTTSRLVSVLRAVLGPRHPSTRIDPVTRTFQALRIAVNDEVSNLESLLESIRRSAEALPTGSAAAWLNPGARVGIISFHSLEDRLVKQHFRELTSRGLATAVTRRPIVADDVETDFNPRARSAKLRVIALADAA
ncbi:MAG: 16S rRNA (cytosine(1402)-N(4))-methyltransferase RsmH, partial [Phycisphaerales bacterium]|nr:16S rRNA (cytosine(1402)-N(4))-methyltransferase RsmH [Phycisphaerales bacterium]